MTWKDFWNAVRTGLTAPSNITAAAENGDLMRDGGFVDQLTSGDLIANEGRYVGEAGRTINDILAGGPALEGYAGLVSSGGKISSDQQEVFNDLMATEATNSAREFEEHMRDTDISSSASQLQALGLSPSGLAGATAGHSGVAPAKVGTGNPAMDRYNRKLDIARSLIGLAGSMASSGIYGASRIAVKNLAGHMAESAAHSAVKVPFKSQSISQEDWNKLFE